MKLESVSLADKYELQEGRVYMTGTQALIRLPLMQRQRDLAAGLNTAGFISGYRGSPLGGVDQQLWLAQRYLEENQIQFQPGVNEELAATAVWGSQQSQLFNDSNVDGIFGMWYGKGPGVDRSGDVFKHANAAGSSRYGGVLALAGDDHNCKSSTLPHQTEYAFMDACIPVLYPTGVQEFLDLGLHGIEMSRFSGCWTAFKILADNIETSASVYVSKNRVNPVIPTDFDMPEGGLNIRIPHTPLEQEHLLHQYKIYAALAYCKANKLDRTIIESPKRRLGIITAGKTYLDVRQALEDLQITEDYAKEIGLSIYKVGMVWPLERDGIREFAEGHEEIIVIEEKRALLENQIKEQLYNWNENVRPRVVGKFDENRDWILPSISDLTPARIARVLVDRLRKMKGGTSSEMESHFENRLAFLDDKEKELHKRTASVTRIPYFCSGCPHNISTKLPEESRGLAGIGCHYMASWMDRQTHTFTQMGGEGTPWVGQAKFSKTKHIFANLGDGTYFHSGILAIRQAITADVNITYKILYNDAVAMTGGQPIDGAITSGDIAHQVNAEGAKKVVVVTDKPEKYTMPGWFPADTEIFHRHDLDHVQRMLRDMEGVTVLIYDQTCAAEKRRRRKRGTYPDPAKRVFINEAACEGCGDCGEVSNCVSVTPKETSFGRKRAIDQSGCNKDFACVDGFCPSFVTVYGGRLRKGKGASDGTVAKAGVNDIFETLPDPEIPAIDDPYGILITGVGGTGVVTIGALLGMAAHLEGKGCSVLDMAGLAQKGGAVTCHIQIANTPEEINAVRIAAGGAKLVLGCDMITASNFDAMSKTERDHTKAIINTHESVTGEFTKNPDFTIPTAEIKNIIRDGVGKNNAYFVNATEIATALMGDSIASNMFMLGHAFQNGFIPVSEAAIMQAIELNGVAIKANRKAFLWGRRTAYNLGAIKKIIGKGKADPKATEKAFPKTAEEIITHRKGDLIAYQNRQYATLYEGFVRKLQTAEKSVMGNITEELTSAGAKYLYKLMAYKDEYEVARLYTDGRFMKQLHEAFEGDFKVKIHLAPPVATRIDPNTGKPVKREYGAWMLKMMKILSLFKGLRGTRLDPFGYTAERKTERRLITEYQEMLDMITKNLNKQNHATAVALATLPEYIRGYGYVKDRHLADVEADKKRLLEQFENPTSAMAAE